MNKKLKEKKLNSLLSSYYLAREEEPFDNLRDLQQFLRISEKKIIDIKELQEKVEQLKKEEEEMIKKEKMIAKLFTNQNELRPYRFASTFCPNCKMFKNYKKECPYCTFLEMTF